MRFLERHYLLVTPKYCSRWQGLIFAWTLSRLASQPAQISAKLAELECNRTGMSLKLQQEADSLNRSQEERASSTSKGKTRKLKGIPYSELEAMRERRRAERREEHKDRPKTKYKGLTWHVTKAGKGQGQWHVQVWTGKTVSLP